MGLNARYVPNKKSEIYLVRNRICSFSKIILNTGMIIDLK